MMKYALGAVVALAVSAFASPSPDAVSSAIAPSSSAPPGCSSSFSGNFEFQIVNVSSSSKRDLVLPEKRQVACGGTGTLLLTLQNGLLLDSKGRTGYIAANRQFQFDGPPQAGAIYTSGWSVCGNGSLALGGSAIFYQCLSGTFYNLYDQSQGAQCSQVYIDTFGCISSSAPVTVASSLTSAQGESTASSVSTSFSSSSSSSATTSSVAYVMSSYYRNATTSATSGVALSTGAAASSSNGTKASSATPTTSAITQSTGAADVLAVGKTLAGLAAGFAAFAMF